MTEPVELYRVFARSKTNGCQMKRWQYSSRKAFVQQAKRRKNWGMYYDIICEKFDLVTNAWQVLTE